MAYQTGTATDYQDFYDTLIAFLTTDPELVAESQNWVVVWQPDSNSSGDNGSDIVLRGPGLSATDQVYVGFRLIPDVLNDSAQIRMVGMTGVIPSALNYNEHVNVSEAVGFFVRGNNPVDYWLNANGRRIVGCVQPSTVYEGFYAGLFLPYGDPTQYTFPMMVGGTTGATDQPDEAQDWRDVSTAHTNFHRAEVNSAPFDFESSLQMLDPMGTWRRAAITDEDTDTGHTVFITPWNFVDSADWGIDKASLSTSHGYAESHSRVVQAYDESFVVTPIGLFYTDRTSTSAQFFGVLEGVYHVAGRGNSAENIITVDGIDHIAFPNVFRTGIDQFWAMQLGFPEDSNSRS